MDNQHLAEQKRLRYRKNKNKAAQGVFMLATLVGLLVLIILFYQILREGLAWLDLQFLNSYPSRFAEKAGIKAAWLGTLWMMALIFPISFPLGVGAAIYLEEVASDSWLSRIIQTNISNLAGIPSIIYGILGLTIFVRWMALGRSLLAGALTMSLLILPIIIVASQEAIRSVSDSLRHASLALGATRWQTIRRVVLPSAFPGILTGTILALSRAIGETAPLIMIGALTFIPRAPKTPLDPFTVMPIQIYNWTTRPQDEFRGIAAAGIIVLLIMLLSMNALAIFLRNKYQKKI
ncbi:MAG: phosphate transport system permease protein [Clostridia bacterium]|jgi:phosphate transport system permease protein|nr:phosphate transporter permease [Clostridiales bacterium]MDK2986700.1 phosphate transport system permease protein [Clostridia bacterium]